MTEIEVATQRIELESTLAHIPKEWSLVIGARIALRVLPFAIRHTHPTPRLWHEQANIQLIRGALYAWTLSNYLQIVHSKTGLESADAIDRDVKVDVLGSAQAAAAADAIHCVAASLISPPERIPDRIALAAHIAAEFVVETEDKVLFWQAVYDDLGWLQRSEQSSSRARHLTRRRLWLHQVPRDFYAARAEAIKGLQSLDPNYSVWIDWYERRIRGERAAFDIPGDKGRIEDKKILRRLAEATDEDFWGKGHEYVNATLKGWLDEARARVAPPPVIAESSAVFEITGSATAELGPLPTPPQEASAIAYGVNEQGKLDRLPNSNQAHLRDVPDQRRAYDDLREAAAELLGEGQRLGHRLQRALGRFLNSLPDVFEDAEAYLVWRDANALRRLHRAHREAAKSSEPDEARLEPVVAEGLGGLLDLYNNFAFADDGLRAKDEARVAPQELASAEAEAKAASPLVEAILANPEIATPEALDDILADEENAELPADDPYSAQVLQQCNESRKNFLAAALAWGAKTLASPKQVGKAVAIGSVTGAAGVVGKVAMTSIIGTDYGPLLPFIAANAEILQHYVAIAFPSFEHLPSLIDQLKLLRAKLRN